MGRGPLLPCPPDRPPITPPQHTRIARGGSHAPLPAPRRAVRPLLPGAGQEGAQGHQQGASAAVIGLPASAAPGCQRRTPSPPPPPLLKSAALGRTVGRTLPQPDVAARESTRSSSRSDARGHGLRPGPPCATPATLLSLPTRPPCTVIPPSCPLTRPPDLHLPQVYFDITIDDKPAGRIVMGLVSCGTTLRVCPCWHGSGSVPLLHGPWVPSHASTGSQLPAHPWL